MAERPTTAGGPVFVVGCPRSGTTLLQRMLDAHPGVAIAPETHFVRRFWLRRRRYGDLQDDARFDRLVNDVAAMHEFGEMGLDAARFRSAAWSDRRDVARLFRLLLEQFAERRGGGLVGEKTPNHLLYMPLLARWFPEARFVHIVRDPRAVVNSWRTVPWSTGSVGGDARVWRRYLATARRRPPPSQTPLIQLRYEDLVGEPETALRAVCEFLGITFEQGMLEHQRSAAPTTNVAREPWKASAMQPITTEPANRWEDSLAPGAVSWIEAAVGAEMRRFGYVPRTPAWRRLPLATAAALWRPLAAMGTLIRKLARLELRRHPRTEVGPCAK